jgi:hypothetical protein
MMRQVKDNEPTVSQEDIEAKAYFDPPDGARDWIEIGRRRLKYQMNKFIERAARETQGKWKIAFPMDTESVFFLLGMVGYRANRKSFDYCIRHGHMKLPPKDDGRLAWGVENAIDFGMQLERLRYWSPGCHESKKTVWELQAEVEADRPFYELARDQEYQKLDADGVLGRMSETKDRDYRQAMYADVIARLWRRGIRADATAVALLEQMVDEDDAAQRKALATVIRKHIQRLELE